MNRREQYRRKFDFIIEKITRLPKEVEENEFYVDALFYRLQVSIDAIMDLVAMLCKDLGISVKDDYSNLDELEKKKIFDPSIIQEIRRMNGLRNALVHKYNKVEEDLVLKEKDKVVITIKSFVNKIEDIIDEKLNLLK